MDLSTAILLVWMTTCCRENQVEPEFARAVMQVESGNKHHQIRWGRLGRSKYAGPFGLHIAYVREKFGVDATDPWVNVAVGVRALRNTQTTAQKERRLRRYNTEFNPAYWRAVMRTYKKLGGKG